MKSSPYLKDVDLLLEIIEDAYHEWRSLQRFGFMTSDNAPDFGINTLVYKDSHLNDLILRTYRLFEEKLKGRPNLVYRQVQAGTNACFSVHHQEAPFAEGYEKLAEIPVIDTVMLRTPMILHPKSSKRTGMFTETDVNPMNYLNLNPEEWFCFPMKVGGLLCYVYFNAKYTASALSLANLFEIATKEETSAKPDLVVIFGNEDGKTPLSSITIPTTTSGLAAFPITPDRILRISEENVPDAAQPGHDGKRLAAHSRRLREHHPEGWPQEGHHAHGRFRRREI